MNLYKIHQNTNMHFNTYDSCIVVASSKKEARHINPDNFYVSWDPSKKQWFKTNVNGSTSVNRFSDTWTSPKNVIAVKIGKANKKYTMPMVILASFCSK